MKAIVYTKYGARGASSRYRILQYLPYLRECGWEFEIDSLVPDAHLQRLYAAGTRSKGELLWACAKRLWRIHGRRQPEADVCFVQYELLPYAPFILEAAAYRRVSTVVDYDDATYTVYQGRGFLERKIPSVIKNANHIIAGNRNLYEFARRYNESVEIIPTVVDLKKYTPRSEYRWGEPRPVVGWIGTPVTQKHLLTAAPALVQLAHRRNFLLRAIGVSDDFSMPGVEVEQVRWSEESEARVIRTFDVGIMPLPTSCPFAAGKCGFKLIQSMACGVPVVGTALGANRDIIADGENGFLAHAQDEFFARVDQLLSDEDLRMRLGRNARETVEHRFNLGVTAPVLANTLTRVSREGRA